MVKKPKVTVTKDYLKNLKRKVEDLKTLTEISAIISSILDFNELMTLVMEKAKSVMDAEACSILLYNRDIDKLEFEVAICKDESTSDILKKKITLDMGQGIAGWVAANQKPLVIKDVKADNRFFQEADKQTGFTTKGLVAMPLIGRRGLIGVAEIINPKNEDYDLEIFQILTKQFAIAIENALFHRESLERERIKQELEIAAVLQKSFLPASPVLKKGNIMVSAVNISAAKVGGDIYDFVEPVSDKVGVFIGDVSGKGISAALYMAKFISDFRYIAHMVDSPEIVLNRLNSILSEAPRGMFLTAIYAVVDTITGRLQVSVAGHPPFLLITKTDVQITSIPSGPPLGMIPADYSFDTISLKSGDRMLLLTDGVFEAKNKQGQRIGFDNLVSFVKKNIDKEKLVEVIVDYVNDFSRGVERADDLTIVELRFSG
jgi:sigma-B regulation protein RsbU (phosphoserine phosphatase)